MVAATSDSSGSDSVRSNDSVASNDGSSGEIAVTEVDRVPTSLGLASQWITRRMRSLGGERAFNNSFHSNQWVGKEPAMSPQRARLAFEIRF